jgi:hypothetical protein
MAEAEMPFVAVFAAIRTNVEKPVEQKLHEAMPS